MSPFALEHFLIGPLLMTLAMAFFALEDMFLKSAMRQVSVGLGLICFGFGGMILFVIWARLRGEAPLHPAMTSRPLVLRSACEVLGRLFYTLAFALAPLSLVSAILQATPLVVALGAVVFFNERVGWRRWSAIVIGFVGVLMILRPGTDAFELTSVFAVLGMLGFAGRDLGSRASPASMSNAQLGVLGFAMLVVAGGIMVLVTGPGPLPDAASARDIALAVLVGVLAYSALTEAMRVGTVSVTVPFRYTRLLFAMILGIVVFGESPDTMTLLGSAVIVLSGLVVIRRGQRG